MTSSEDKLVHSALLEIEAVIRDLHWTVPNGYYMGYNLGYAKGVLEHLLRNHPNCTTRGDYLKGYPNGYAQGLLYLVRNDALGRPQKPQGMEKMPKITQKTIAEETLVKGIYGLQQGYHDNREEDSSNAETN